MHSEGSRCLPPELLWPIAEHVTKADRIQCALVCKAWRPIFQAKLHEDLSFTRKRHLIKHLANIKHSVNDNDDTATMATSTTLGQLTQKLYLDERIRLTRGDMVYLADMMPNLRSLQFNPLLWSELGYHPAFKRWQKLRQLPRLTDEAAAVAMMDDMGHRLVELSISFPLAVELHKKGKLLPLLEQTPRVKTFSMDINELEMDAENELCLTLDNFLAIFRAMPQLVVFSSHEFKLLDISREDKVYDIQPTKVQSLTLGCAFKDIRWTTVISKLFPKAQSVTLGIRLLTDQERQQQEEQQPQSTATDDAVSQQDDSYNREMLLNMIISFKDMRSLVLDGFCAEITRILTAEHLTTALKLAGRQLQNLNYFAYQEIYDHRSPWQYLDVMDPQTQELSISTKIRRVPLYDFLNPLSQHFHRLTHLNLYMAYPRTIVNVPMTLSLFPSLDTLHLWNCTLESRDEDRGRELLTGHPLQNLTLKLVDILNPCLWDVFARSCPKLSNVTLGTCTVHLEHDNIPFSMHFNFPHHTLDTVEIYTLNFFRRYRPISNLGRGPARLLSVVSHAKIEHTIARRQRANVDTTCGGIEEERWYHQYRDDSDYVDESKGLRVKRLSSYSGDEIRAFCSNIEAQLLFFDPMPYDSAAPFSKNEWWRALPNGYVNISSRSVRKIIFNHVHISYK